MDKRTDIIQHFTYKSEVFQVEKDRFWMSKIYSLPDQQYQFIGRPAVNTKQIIKCFYGIWKGSFYIPIDLSHLTGSPCLLNYTFDKNLSFEDHWNQIRIIKKNHNNFLFEKDEQGQPKWRQYLSTAKAWVTFGNNQSYEHSICSQRFDYDKESLQGLGIVLNKNDSRWTFSFFAEPNMMAYFV